MMWCSHAEKSEWVGREAAQAIDTKKRVVPVLLDKTPLPERLRRYQVIDFSERIKHSTLLEAVEDASGACFRGLWVFVVEAKGCAIPLLIFLVFPMIMLSEPSDVSIPEIGVIILFLAELVGHVFGAVLALAIVGSVVIHQFRVRRLGKELAIALEHNSSSAEETGNA